MVGEKSTPNILFLCPLNAIYLKLGLIKGSRLKTLQAPRGRV